MTTLTIPGFGRSLGLKLLLICGLVVLMGIPALFISAVSYERSTRANEVTAEVSNRYGGAQTVSGPILVVPYYVTNLNGAIESGGDYVVFAENGKADIDGFETTIRKRSLFKVPTYQTRIDMEARFVIPEIPNRGAGRTRLLWKDARILVGVSDISGLRDDVYLDMPGYESVKFTPAVNTGMPVLPIEEARFADHFKFAGHMTDRVSSAKFMQVRVGDLIAGHEKVGEGAHEPQTPKMSKFSLKTSLSIGGSRGISVTPFAQSTKVNIVSDWPHPGFNGKFAPTTREISDNGFTASWTVPSLARGIPAHGVAGSLQLGDMMQSKMSVSLVNPVDPYQKVNRALKYAVMFIGLVFLTYFLFETIVGVRVHAAQYVLIGLAQTIFYLLLLAFSEHIGFTLAFVIAALATVSATAGYAGAVFGGRKYIAKAALVFGTVYGLLYILMRLEDFALMVGALTSFLAIAGTMYLTRNVNWYGREQEGVSNHGV